MSHPSRDDLTAYALGALEPGEERELERHATDCEQCAAELRHLAPAVGVLAESVEQIEPPASLRQSLMATVRSEAVAEGRAEESAQSGVADSRPRRSRFGNLLFRPATGLAVLALGAAAVGGYLVADDSGEPATTIAVDPSVPGVGGEVVIEDDAATLHVHGMPRLAKGAVYQVWVNENGAIHPSASFVPHEDGTATAAVPEVASGAKSVMVTEEPRPGRTKPTFPALLGVRID